MNDPAFCIPLVNTTERDSVTRLQRTDARGKINVVRDQKGLTRGQPQDEMLMTTAVRVIRQDCPGASAREAPLGPSDRDHAAAQTLSLPRDPIAAGVQRLLRRRCTFGGRPSPVPLAAILPHGRCGGNHQGANGCRAATAMRHRDLVSAEGCLTATRSSLNAKPASDGLGDRIPLIRHRLPAQRVPKPRATDARSAVPGVSEVGPTRGNPVHSGFRSIPFDRRGRIP